MNFLDTYDLARSTTPNPNQGEQPSLNEEVNQVIGQLGRFWGGFRKQSQSALETARKDFSQVVEQAQKELTKLTVAEAPHESSQTTEESEKKRDDAAESSTSTEDPTPSSSRETPQPSTSGSSQNLFSRLQSSLPPNIVATVQNNIPESLKHASENIDLAGVRTNLLSEFQRVQGATLAQAEEYVHKSEALLREVAKEAGEVLRDAVKVVPPDQAGGDAARSSGMLWDGTDMWMLPSDPGESSSAGKEKEGTSSGKITETQSAVATRAEALLRRLKRDPTILGHDPEADEGVKTVYCAWREAEVETKDGGLDGAEWQAKIAAALEESVEGPALKELEETLVPSEMTKSTFWLRFFFRVHQIRLEEEKRKALIQSSTDNDEDFSWEDDEDESSPTSEIKPTLHAATKSNASADDKTIKERLSPSGSRPGSGGTPSPRVSSEDSFDLVSSSNVSVAGDVKTPQPSKPKPGPQDDDDDSDWE
ncbi:unnamed protein product [Cyclocybe aegerita]|uniref:BSD domain-containing protein n=1 Tax=Cyclocybe aegerita TaxID=1973307 RepID=A0A8S0W1M3_CYCAE|nr:unnamed protein product [Cyclocybe aegerita]